LTVMVLQVFVSLMLVAGSIAMFVFSARQKDFEHADRLALAPLEADAAADPRAAADTVTQKLPEEKVWKPDASNTTTP